jgi:hypothetical protein
MMCLLDYDYGSALGSHRGKPSSESAIDSAFVRGNCPMNSLGLRTESMLDCLEVLDRFADPSAAGAMRDDPWWNAAPPLFARHGDEEEEVEEEEFEDDDDLEDEDFDDEEDDEAFDDEDFDEEDEDDIDEELDDEIEDIDVDDDEDEFDDDDLGGLDDDEEEEPEAP